MSLTIEQQATNFVTFRHIERVRNLLNLMAIDLIRRGEQHDQSKLESPEVELFTEFTPKLAASTYGSSEYEGFRQSMWPALEHHYAKNSHHPEHWPNGINDMNLLDLLEMFCDWRAAGEGIIMGIFLSLLWEFRIQYSDELSKSELRSIIEVIALLIIKVKK